MAFLSKSKEKIFITKQAAADGKYELQLFDWKGSKQWKTIQVDDYLPCAPRKGKAPFQQPMFADLSDGEMYVPLLEKAFAKLFGSYQESWLFFGALLDIRSPFGFCQGFPTKPLKVRDFLQNH